MANPVKMLQWQRQFDACCGRVPPVARVVTAVERATLEVDPLDAIGEEYGEVFGGKR